MIVHIHGASYMKFYRTLNEKKKSIVRKSINKADLIIALSDTWKKLFEDEIGFKNIFVLKNEIDSDSFASARIIEDEAYSRILFLGRLGKRKGAYDLVHSIRKLKNKGINLKCIMAGDGEIKEIQELSKELKVDSDIECVGWIDINKKKKLLKESSVLVLPSYNEGLPMAILEAMSAGKVIISTTVGAIPEVIDNMENGILIEAGDIESLAIAIEKIISNRKLAQQISTNNIRKIKEQYERKSMHSKLKVYFEAII